MRQFIVLSVACGLCLVGCARLTGTTDLKPDGTWTRKVKISRSNAANQTGQVQDKLDDMVKFAGSGWQTSTRVEKSDEVYEGTRTMAADNKGGDDYVLGTKDKPTLACAIKWTPIGDGKVLYEETYTWKGDPPDQAKDKESRDKMKAGVAKALGDIKTSEQQLDKIVDNLVGRLWKEIMGPNDPKFFDLFVKPEETFRILRIDFYHQVLDDLRAANLGGDEATRQKAARAIAIAVIESGNLAGDQAIEPPGPPDQPENKKDLGPVMIQSTLGFPGTVQESNGNVDPVDGRVYWSMVSEAPQRGTVIFRALIDTKK